MRAVEGDREIAISVHNPDADLPTGCVFYDDRAVDFTFTGEGQAISADRQISWRGRCRCIARNHRRGCRDIARLIGQGDIQGLAIGLRRVEGDFEAAISPDRPGTNHRALGVFDGNGAAHFAFTRQGQAIGAEDHAGWCFRCSGVAGNHAANLRDVARFVGQGDVEGFAVGLSSIQDDFEAAISPDNPSTDLQAFRVFDDDGAADFAFTGEGQAICAYRQTGWCFRCGGITRHHTAAHRDIASRIGLSDSQCFAVGLCWRKSDFKAAVSAHRAGADHIACRILHGDGAANFAFTAQGQAICANTQAGRGFRCSGVARYHAANLRDVARFVGQGDIEGFAVGLRAVEDDREITLSVHNACADL